MRSEVLQLQDPMMRVRAEQLHLLQTAPCFVPQAWGQHTYLHMAGGPGRCETEQDTGFLSLYSWDR